MDDINATTDTTDDQSQTTDDADAEVGEFRTDAIEVEVP